MLDNYARIICENPHGNSDKDLEYILAHGGQLKEDHLLKQRTILKNALVWPDGTEYQRGHALPAGISLPKGSIVKVNTLPKQALY